MSDAIIHIENLSKKYSINKASDSLTSAARNIFSKKKKEEIWALKDINFQVKRGEAIGIIGENGAGKSTLLKILSKITPPTKGRALLRGKVASLLEVGTGFHSELTGRENIFLNGSLLGMHRKEIKQKLDEIIAFSGVEKFIDTPVKKYSSGMYVRLAFSVAAHLDSDILLVDEVLAVGDYLFRSKGIEKMKDLSMSGRSIVFVSHDLKLIDQFCDNSIYLKNGQLQFYGKTRDAIQRYREFYKNSPVDGVFDCSNHPDKEYKDFGIKSCWFSSNNIINGLVYPGKIFKIGLQVYSDKFMSEIEIGFVLKDENQNPLVGINNEHLGSKFSLPKGDSKFEITIDPFPFYGINKVFVDLFLGSTIYKYEKLRNAFVFEIFHSNVYGGRNLDESKNLIILDNIAINPL